MKLAKHRRLGTLATLAVLLAAMSTGALSLCEIFFGVVPEDGPDVAVTVTAGNTANDFASLGSLLSRIAVCNLSVTSESSERIPAGAGTVVPAGVYCRTNRDFRGKPVVSADLVTSSSTPPGNYVLEYRDASPGSYIVGTLNLTVEAAEPNDVVAELYVTSKNEFLLVNEPVILYGCLSQSPASDPIVEYRWWFNYNGNPSSPPSEITTICTNNYTYTTPGTKTARLVVRTQNDNEDEDVQTFNVVAGQ